MTLCDQIFGLLHTKLDAIGLDCLIVCLDFFETNQNLFRHLGLSELAHSVEAVIAENRHDSRNDLTLDASDTAVPDPIVENLIVKEELCNDEISSSIHLFLQVTNVVLSRRGLQMHFGVPSHTDAEEVTVLLTNVFNEICGVIESIFGCYPIGSTSRRVSAKGEQVSDAKLARFIKGFFDLVACHVGARDVHEDVEAAVLLDMVTEVQSDVTRGAASVPGDVNPERIGLAHALDSVEKVLDSGLCPRWEILE